MSTGASPRTISATASARPVTLGGAAGAGAAGGSTLPAAVECERGLAGCILIDGRPMLDYARRVGIMADAFTEPAYRLVFEIASECDAKRAPIDILTIMERAKSSGALDRLGGVAALDHIVDATPTTAHVEYYAREVAAAAAARRALAQFDEAQRCLREGDGAKAIEAAQHAIEVLHVRPALDLIDAGTLASTEPPAADAVLADFFDTGDKVPLIGSSKSRKSFFVLMLALLIAAGRDRFLCWRIPKRRRVLLVQFEIKSAHFHGRVFRLARALGIAPNELTGWLFIVNARGQTVTPDGFIRLAKSTGAELVILDPLYKLLTGDENAAADMKPLLSAFDRLAEETRAAVLYVHHHGKGFAGDRDTRDRGAGSGVLARDFDAALYLCDHATDEDLLVLSTLARNYPATEAVTIAWREGRFEVTDDAPVERTSRNRQTARKATLDEYRPRALAQVASGPLPMTAFRERLKTAGMTREAARALVDILTTGDAPDLAVFESRAYNRHEKTIGTPEQIEAIRAGQKGLTGLTGLNSQDAGRRSSLELTGRPFRGGPVKSKRGSQVRGAG